MKLKEYTGLDPRVYMLLLLCAAICSMLAASEASIAMLFGIALLFQLPGRNARSIPAFLVSYLLCYGITRLGVLWLTAMPAFSMAITVTNFGLAARRSMAPILFAVLLAKVPVGSFIAALYALRLPKPFSIGAAILLRFFPTLAQEYRCIRSAQKFRGIGVGFWDTLLHLPGVIRYLLIPLIIRITRIADELSASVTVRGVRFGGKVVSLREVRFGGRDALFLTAGAAAFFTALLFGSGMLKGGAA